MGEKNWASYICGEEKLGEKKLGELTVLQLGHACASSAQ